MINKLPMFILLLLTCFSGTIIAAPMVGNYTINSAVATGGTNFQSIQECADTLAASGITGNVTITIKPGSGPYHETVEFLPFTGGSATATVTLDGSYETVIAFIDSNNTAAIRLSDQTFFNVNNLRMERDTASTYNRFYGVHIFNSGSNITISGCHVNIEGTISTLTGSYIASGSKTSILDDGNFEFISILNDTAVGGGSGASVYGILGDLATNINIANNHFYDFNDNGIYLRETDGANITYNFFDKRTANVSSTNAIQVAQANNINTSISNNFIQLTQVSNGTQGFKGIYLFNGTGHKVYNNVISGINLTSGDFEGIVIRAAGIAPEIYFNTISIDNAIASTGNLFGISEELTNTNAILRNNLISISQPTSGIKAGLALASNSTPTTAFDSDHNLIWVPGGNVAIKNSTTPVLYPTLSDWQSISNKDANSYNVDPLFASFNSPLPANVVFDNGGITIAGYTQDVDGVTRGSLPDIGAYEFTSTGINSVLENSSLSIYPNPCKDFLKVKIASAGENIPVITDIAGKNIEVKFEVVDQNSMIINTNGLSSGIYYINMQSAKNRTLFIKE